MAIRRGAQLVAFDADAAFEVVEDAVGERLCTFADLSPAAGEVSTYVTPHTRRSGARTAGRGRTVTAYRS